MGFRSVWPWRAAEMIALEKNILSTLEPFPSLQSENWRGGGGLDLMVALAGCKPHS